MDEHAFSFGKDGTGKKMPVFEFTVHLFTSNLHTIIAQVEKICNERGWKVESYPAYYWGFHASCTFYIAGELSDQDRLYIAGTASQDGFN